MKVEVDAVMCQAHGLCVARVPQVFELPDDAAVTRGPADGDVPADLVGAVEEAALECPEQAILLR